MRRWVAVRVWERALLKWVWLAVMLCGCPDIPPALPPDMAVEDLIPKCTPEGESCASPDPCCNEAVTVCIAFQIPPVCCTTMMPVPCGDGGRCCPRRDL